VGDQTAKGDAKREKQEGIRQPRDKRSPVGIRKRAEVPKNDERGGVEGKGEKQVQTVKEDRPVFDCPEWDLTERQREGTKEKETTEKSDSDTRLMTAHERRDCGVLAGNQRKKEKRNLEKRGKRVGHNKSSAVGKSRTQEKESTREDGRGGQKARHWQTWQGTSKKYRRGNTKKRTRTSEVERTGEARKEGAKRKAPYMEDAHRRDDFRARKEERGWSH